MFLFFYDVFDHNKPEEKITVKELNKTVCT